MITNQRLSKKDTKEKIMWKKKDEKENNPKANAMKEERCEKRK